MELNFDKEIDALLRRSARDGGVVPAAHNLQSHLDADEISAFAENALPEKTRVAYTAHLADCDRCRKILSNVISLNAETQSEIIHAQEQRQIIASPIPWYRKLVAFPNLAYTLGALVLIFSGVAVFTVLQSVNDSKNAEVSQVTERQTGGKGMSSDGGSAPVESYSSNSIMSNTASENAASTNSAAKSAANVSNPAMPPAPVITSNSNMTATRDELDDNLKPAPKSVELQKEPADSAKTENLSAGAPARRENNFQLDNEAERQKQLSQNSVAQNQANIAPDARNVQRAPSATLQAESKNKKVQESKDDAQEKAAETTTSSGGKTFKRAGNVWVDSAYRGQTTTNITRGTKEYKKLDSGLRVIVENLGGTVVVVWKEKAYRIQ